MADSPKRVSWDACTWIALIQQEKIRDDKGNVIENRYALARSVVDLAGQDKIEIATSGLSLAEVCKNPAGSGGGDDKIAPFFEQPYILIVNVDTQVGTIARRLMMAKHAGLKPLDAIHLATAIVANVDEMHTFDDRLLALNEKLVKNDGTELRICKPAYGGPPLPLLEATKASMPVLAEAPAKASQPDSDESKSKASDEVNEKSKEETEVTASAAPAPKAPENSKEEKSGGNAAAPTQPSVQLARNTGTTEPESKGEAVVEGKGTTETKPG